MQRLKSHHLLCPTKKMQMENILSNERIISLLFYWHFFYLYVGVRAFENNLLHFSSLFPLKDCWDVRNKLKYSLHFILFLVDQKKLSITANTSDIYGKCEINWKLLPNFIFDSTDEKTTMSSLIINFLTNFFTIRDCCYLCEK